MCCLMTTAGGGYIASSPALQAQILVSTMTPNAQNIYSYYSNGLTMFSSHSNVSFDNCLPAFANLSAVSDVSGSLTIRSGSCPTGTYASNTTPFNGLILCDPNGLGLSNVFINSKNVSNINPLYYNSANTALLCEIVDACKMQ